MVTDSNRRCRVTTPCLLHTCEVCVFETHSLDEIIQHVIESHGADASSDLDGYFLSREAEVSRDT